MSIAQLPDDILNRISDEAGHTNCFPVIYLASPGFRQITLDSGNNFVEMQTHLSDVVCIAKILPPFQNLLVAVRDLRERHPELQVGAQFMFPKMFSIRNGSFQPFMLALRDRCREYDIRIKPLSQLPNAYLACKATSEPDPRVNVGTLRRTLDDPHYRYYRFVYGEM